jgi:hypothetical protein
MFARVYIYISRAKIVKNGRMATYKKHKSTNKNVFVSRIMAEKLGKGLH